MTPGRARAERARRLGAGLVLGFALAAPLYLVLIDIAELPELLVGAAAALLAAVGFALVREQEVAGASADPRWLLRLYRPLLQAPLDVAHVCAALAAQLAHPRAVHGRFWAAPFRAAGETPRATGRRAAAEAFGSFAPNTIVVGVDTQRNLILAHKLRGPGDPESIDLLGLG